MSPYDSNTLVGTIAVVDVFWAEIADSIGAMEQVGFGTILTNLTLVPGVQLPIVSCNQFGKFPWPAWQ